MPLTGAQLRYLFAKGILARNKAGKIKYSRDKNRAMSRSARIAAGQDGLRKFLNSPRGRVFGGPTATPAEFRGQAALYASARSLKREGTLGRERREAFLRELETEAITMNAKYMSPTSLTYKGRAQQVKKGIKALRRKL